MESVTAPDGGLLTFSYRGSLLESATWSGADVNGTVAWSYDNDQRVASETVSCPTTSGLSCDTIDYEYDSDDLLIRAGDLVLQHHPTNGVLTGTTLNQLGDAYTWNEYGEVERYEAFFIDHPVFTQEMTRDVAGRIIKSIEMTDGAATTYEYSYDSARRLSSVKKNGVQTASYTYDGNGNRLTRTTQSGTAHGTYDSEDRIQTYAGATYVHTPADDLRTVAGPSGTMTYSYDELGNLTRVVLPNGDVIEYVIDGLNRRIAKTRNGVVEQRWLYRNALQLAAELDSNGEVSRRFVYGTRVNVPDVMITPAGTFRIVSDHLGSVRVVINAATGAITQRIDYDEFGNVLVDTNPGFQPFGFAGGLDDADAQLIRFGARDYDPRSGRWAVKDPIFFAGGDTNLYSYTFGDPVNFIDPTGLFTQGQCAAAREILRRERRWGTYRTARRSSNTWGDGTLAPFNNDLGNDPTFKLDNGQEIDLDWFTDLQGSVGFLPGLSPAAYGFGKTAWWLSNLGQHGYNYPFKEAAERTAIGQSTEGMTYTMIFTPELITRECGCGQ